MTQTELVTKGNALADMRDLQEVVKAVRGWRFIR